MSIRCNRRQFTSSALVAALAVVPVPGLAKSATPLASDITAQLEAVVQSYFDAAQFRGAVLVSYRGETLLRTPYGIANEITGAENTP